MFFCWRRGDIAETDRRATFEYILFITFYILILPACFDKKTGFFLVFTAANELLIEERIVIVKSPNDFEINFCLPYWNDVSICIFMKSTVFTRLILHVTL